MKKLKKILLITCLLIITAAIGCGIYISAEYNNAYLDKNELMSYNSGVIMYDNNNRLLDEQYGIQRQIVDVDTLPDYVKNAFVAIEDKRFYRHNGYDIKRMIKSMIVNLKSGSKKQGGSTITQQLIKNTMLTSDKTYKRKIKEIMLATKAEKEFSKDQILQMYLNTIYFGSNAYGIENASKIYFNKSADKLTISEVALLAGIIKSPNKYSPKTNTQQSLMRRDLVLSAMHKNGHITKQQYDDAKKEKIIIADIKNQYENSYYQSVLNQACKILGVTEKDLIVGQYKIYTYLDNDLQEKITAQINNSNFENADKLIIVANINGEINAYQGDSFYNLYNMKRQPASVLKPLVVYSPAIAHNILTPATPILDEQISYDNYTPANYDKKFRGWISTREAIAQSLNIPAIKILSYMSFDEVSKFANAININLSADDDNVTLALGSLKDGVTPLQLLSAYSILYNDGKFNNMSFIRQICDQNNNVVFQNLKQDKTVLSSDSAYLMTDMLKTCATKGTAKRLGSLQYNVASKTGTATNGNNKTDVYNVSYTSEHCVLSWIGSSLSEGLPANITSGFSATEMTKQAFNLLYSNHSPKNFVKPETIQTIKFDRLDYVNNHKISLLDDMPERFALTEIFSADNLPTQYSACYDLPVQPVLYVKVKNSVPSIQFDAFANFEYNLYSLANGKQKLLLTVKNENNLINFDDLNAGRYDSVSYFYTIKNLYTNNSVTSDEYKVYPNKFEKENNFIKNTKPNSGTKKKWYI